MPLYNPPALEISFTPSWTNITIGSGTSTGFYTRVGKLIMFRAQFVFGSGSSMGAATLALPVTAIRAPLASQISVTILDSGTAAYWGVVDPASLSTTSAGALGAANSASTYVSISFLSSTVPMTWATNDQLNVSGWYMAA